MIGDALLCRKHCLKKSSPTDLLPLVKDRVRRPIGLERGSTSLWDHAARSF